MVGALSRYTKFPIPANLPADIAATVSRYGRVRLERMDEQWWRLVCDDRPLLAELARPLAEDLAPATQALEGLAAVAPLVVARDEDEAVLDARELRLAHEQPGIGARRGAAADVAHVHHELERLGVHLVDHAIQARDLARRVGHVPEHAEGVLPGGKRGG
jgi:hypothetical protein